MRLRLGAAAATSAAVVATGVSLPATAGTTAWVADRTFVCEPGVRAGIHGVEVRASTPGVFKDAQYALYVIGYGRSHDFLVWAGDEGVRVDVRRCRPVAAARVALRPGALSGGSVTFEDEYDCELPGQILVRVRATFVRRGRWLPRTPRYAGASGKATNATIAVRSLGLRKPIAFASFDTRAGARIFANMGPCVSG